MADNTVLNTGVGGDTIATDDIGGVKYQIVKLAYGALDTATLVAVTEPLPVRVADTDETEIIYWATGVASGTTGTETAITLTRSGAAGAATTSAASFAPTNGKRFRITGVMVASRGNATATAQVTTFTIRVNTGGAVTTTSNAWMAFRTATPATALAWDRATPQLPPDGIEFAANGTIQIGITANAVFTTNAPTWDVFITAVEY